MRTFIAVIVLCFSFAAVADSADDFARRTFITVTMLTLFCYQIFGPDTALIFRSLFGSAAAKRLFRKRCRAANGIVNVSKYLQRASWICVATIIIQPLCLFVYPFTLIGAYPLGLCIVFSSIAIAVTIYVAICERTLRVLRFSIVPFLAFPPAILFTVYLSFRPLS